MKHLLIAALLLPLVINSRSSTSGASATASQAALEARLAGLETRFKQLEARVAALESRSGRGGGAAGALEGGYESVWLRAWLNTQMQVLVDGRPVAMYSRLTQEYLDSFLKRDAVNRITFVFSGHGPGNKVELHVKPQGEGKLRQVFSFSPEASKLQESFEVPFVGRRQ